jgi:hypothetical protein
VLIAGLLVLSFDDQATKVIALVFGAGAAVLALGTDWPTGIVRVIPPLLHGYADGDECSLTAPRGGPQRSLVPTREH